MPENYRIREGWPGEWNTCLNDIGTLGIWDVILSIYFLFPKFPRNGWSIIPPSSLFPKKGLLPVISPKRLVRWFSWVGKALHVCYSFV